VLDICHNEDTHVMSVWHTDVLTHEKRTSVCQTCVRTSVCQTFSCSNTWKTKTHMWQMSDNTCDRCLTHVTDVWHTSEKRRHTCDRCLKTHMWQIITMSEQRDVSDIKPSDVSDVCLRFSDVCLRFSDVCPHYEWWWCVLRVFVSQ